MAAAGGTGAACAACKYQQRRCTPECHLAKYFPQDRPRLFATRTGSSASATYPQDAGGRVGPERSRDAMSTIVFETNAWKAYPAHGCVPIILELDHRIRQAQLQLNQVKERIKAYQQQQQLMICDEDDSLLLHQAPWMQPAQYDMRIMSSNKDDMDMAAANNVVPQPRQHHRDHHIQPPDSSYSHDEMSSYYVDNIDEEMPAPRESSSTDSSEKKAMKELKIESANNSFTLTGAVSKLK